MKLADFAGKNICVLGYGREGKAVVAALEKHAPTCTITIADKSSALDIPHSTFHIQTGEHWLDHLDAFDVIIKSPGIPPQPELKAISYKLTNSTQIFLDTIAGRGAIVIGVTGSKGKSTTSSLIYAILKAAKKDPLLIGNIGEAAIAHVDDIKKGTYAVLEMSSYQLNDLTVSPHIAVVTAFFPDHLDWHGSLEAYLDAKKNITRFQKSDDMVFFNEQSSGAIEIAKEGDGRKIPFSPADAPIVIEDTHVIGEHNSSNIAAATLVARELGIANETIVAAIKEFRGLPHRLQSLGVHAGIEWVDDAISTTPESTSAGIAALKGKVTTIILGGQDRGYDFTGLAQNLLEHGIKHVILFPGSGPRIREAIAKADTAHAITLHDAPTMEEAVAIAKKFSILNSPPSATATEGRQFSIPLALLSTASPSYGMFKNFEEKGDTFQKCIKQL